MAEGSTKRDRIDGWKSIADYVNRDVTTVIRWAKFHGLPVNRVPSGSPRRAVFALKSEIDAWVASGASSVPQVSTNVRELTVDTKVSASESSQPSGQQASPAEDVLHPATDWARTKILRWRKPGLYAAAGVLVTFLVWAVWRHTEGFLVSLHAARTTQLQQSEQKPVGSGPIIFRGTFECVSCSADNSYLASGMADQLASDLIRIPGVHVRTLEAERNHSGGEPIKLVLTASIAPRESSRIAVSIFLANSDTHEQVWFGHYEALATGLPALEFEIANDVFLYLKPYLPTRDTTPFKAVWTRDPVAYDLYLRGRNHLLYPGPKTTPAAIQEFSEAVRRDPLFAAAYGGLAHAYYVATFDAGISVLKAMPLVSANARREIELDEFAPEGRAYLAFEEFAFEHKWQTAERELQRAISLNPDDPLPHLIYVYLLLGERRWQEAAQQAQVSESLEPSGLKADFGLALAELAKWGETRNSKDLALAESTCRNAIQRHPDDIRVRDVLVWLLWYSHRYDSAAEENLAMAEVSQDATAISFQRSAKSILAAKGAAQYALDQAHYCEARDGVDYACALEDAAAWYTLGGDAEAALRLLNKLVNARDPSAVQISYDPAFDFLRSDPRFRRLIDEIHPGSD